MTLFDQFNIIFSGSVGATNNTTPITVINDPGSGNFPVFIHPENLGVLNRDTVSSTVILTITGSSTGRIIGNITLSPGDKWANDAAIVIQEGQVLTIELAGSITTNQLIWHASTVQSSN